MTPQRSAPSRMSLQPKCDEQKRSAMVQQCWTPGSTGEGPEAVDEVCGSAPGRSAQHRPHDSPCQTRALRAACVGKPPRSYIALGPRHVQ